MRRQGPALAVGQFGFLELGHAAMSACVEGEGCWQADLGPHRLHDLFKAGE